MRQVLGRPGTPVPGKPEAPRRTTHQARPGAGRHRFIQDGEVPVVRLTLEEGGRGGAVGWTNNVRDRGPASEPEPVKWWRGD